MVTSRADSRIAGKEHATCDPNFAKTLYSNIPSNPRLKHGINTAFYVNVIDKLDAREVWNENDKDDYM